LQLPTDKKILTLKKENFLIWLVALANGDLCFALRFLPGTNSPLFFSILKKEKKSWWAEKKNTKITLKGMLGRRLIFFFTGHALRKTPKPSTAILLFRLNRTRTDDLLLVRQPL
jgi:hypothetical protein